MPSTPSSPPQTEPSQYRIRRSVVIGLGGTGRNVCTQLKRTLLEKTDNDPTRFSHIRFLSIDTDSRVKKIQTDDEEAVFLDPSQEILGLRIPQAFDPMRLRQSMTEEHMELLPHANERGAMRCRPIGNAFLLVNWATIRKRVKELLRELGRADLRSMVRTDPRYEGLDLESGKLDVYVVGNLVSGTGSGMALGMGYLLRDLTAELDDGYTEYFSEGIFTVCGIYALNDHGGKPSPFAVNCYSALLELNHFSDRAVYQDRDEGYDPGFDQVSIAPEARQRSPYDRVQLLHPSHSAVGELSHEELEPQIAEVLALRIGSAVGMTATAKVIDELPNRSRYDSRGNLRFCWAWGASSFRSSAQEVLDLATALAADQVLDVLTGEHVRTAMNRKEEAWKAASSVGFGYAGESSNASLLRRLLTPEEEIEGVPAGVGLGDTIETLVRRAFPRPPQDDRSLIANLPTRIDREKGGLSSRISALINEVTAANRRRLAMEIRDSMVRRIRELGDFSFDGRGSLDDAVAVVDLLVGRGEERGLLRRDSEEYQASAKAALAERTRGEKEADNAEKSIRSIAGMGRSFEYEALIGAWDRFVEGLIRQKKSEARQAALDEARKILDGDGSDHDETLRHGLVRHLEREGRRLRAARQEIKRLDSRFESKIESLEAALKLAGEGESRRLEESRSLKNEALDGESLRLYAREVVEKVLGPSHDAAGRYDDRELLGRDYAEVDKIVRAGLREIGADRFAASIEDNPDFGGRLLTLLESSEPAVRLDPNLDQPPEVAYLSTPPKVPGFVDEVKSSGWLGERDIANKQDDELFQERPDDTEPRVDVLVGRLTFSPASIIGIDRWATLYGRATVSPEGRRSVHTLPDSRKGRNLVFEDLGQTGMRITLAYLVARALGWLYEKDGHAVYEYPRRFDSLLSRAKTKRFGTGFRDLGFLEEFKRPLVPGVRDPELSNPVFVHAQRRFRNAMLTDTERNGVGREDRDALFGSLVIAVAQVAYGKGELASDPHLPQADRAEDFHAFENGLRNMLAPLGLASELFQRVQAVEEVPGLGEIEALTDHRGRRAPFGAPPAPETAPYGPVLVDSSPEEGSRTCPNGHSVGTDARFCPACGAEVRRARPAHCTRCGEPLEPGDQFCSACGARAGRDDAEKPDEHSR